MIRSLRAVQESDGALDRRRADVHVSLRHRKVTVPGEFLKWRETLRVTPAMEAGIVWRPFDVADLANLLIESESKEAA